MTKDAGAMAMNIEMLQEMNHADQGKDKPKKKKAAAAVAAASSQSAASGKKTSAKKK